MSSIPKSLSTIILFQLNLIITYFHESNRLAILFNCKGNERRYLLLRNQESLTENDQIKLQQIFKEYPC